MRRDCPDCGHPFDSMAHAEAGCYEDRNYPQRECCDSRRNAYHRAECLADSDLAEQDAEAGR